MDNDLFYSGKYIICHDCKQILTIERYDNHCISAYHYRQQEKNNKINHLEYFNK